VRGNTTFLPPKEEIEELVVKMKEFHEGYVKQLGMKNYPHPRAAASYHSQQPAPSPSGEGENPASAGLGVRVTSIQLIIT